jgi:hypothetical protein
MQGKTSKDQTASTGFFIALFELLPGGSHFALNPEYSQLTKDHMSTQDQVG